MAYAKVNLALKVLGREPDGYHRIDTFFAFCEEGDGLGVTDGEGLTLRVTGPFAADVPTGEDNLVLRAARALRSGRGATLTLDKRLPVASGLGGGSADAAAALRLLNRFWALGRSEEQLVELARPLGADVPACVLSRPVRGEGRGDSLRPVEAPSGTPILLVNPGVPVSTAEVFRRWRGPGGGTNDLETPALEIAPVIGNVLEALRNQSGATFTAMSGSGATCFALFESHDACDAAAGAIGAHGAGWWTLPTRLR